MHLHAGADNADEAPPEFTDRGGNTPIASIESAWGANAIGLLVALSARVGMCAVAPVALSHRNEDAGGNHVHFAGRSQNSHGGPAPVPERKCAFAPYPFSRLELNATGSPFAFSPRLNSHAAAARICRPKWKSALGASVRFHPKKKCGRIGSGEGPIGHISAPICKCSWGATRAPDPECAGDFAEDIVCDFHPECARRQGDVNVLSNQTDGRMGEGSGNTHAIPNAFPRQI